MVILSNIMIVPKIEIRFLSDKTVLKSILENKVKKFLYQKKLLYVKKLLKLIVVLMIFFQTEV